MPEYLTKIVLQIKHSMKYNFKIQLQYLINLILTTK